ncbi:MAG: AAA family ATPase [Candidatus Omnitrophica bacterium]|nr:AAA family ATPase [Candidatus Omnitrophota bacterium]
MTIAVPGEGHLEETFVWLIREKDLSVRLACASVEVRFNRVEVIGIIRGGGAYDAFLHHGLSGIFGSVNPEIVHGGRDSQIDILVEKKKKKSCIIFFDEIDAVGGARFGEGDSEVQRTMLEIVN